SWSTELSWETSKHGALLGARSQAGAPAIQSVVAGPSPISFQATPPATQLVLDGKLRALAVTATKRSSVLPDVPTLAELGIEGQEAETMQGILVPAGTPKGIVALLEREITALM